MKDKGLRYVKIENRGKIVEKNAKSLYNKYQSAYKVYENVNRNIGIGM